MKTKQTLLRAGYIATVNLPKGSSEVYRFTGGKELLASINKLLEKHAIYETYEEFACKCPKPLPRILEKRLRCGEVTVTVDPKDSELITAIDDWFSTELRRTMRLYPWPRKEDIYFRAAQIRAKTALPDNRASFLEVVEWLEDELRQSRERVRDFRSDLQAAPFGRPQNLLEVQEEITE